MRSPKPSAARWQRPAFISSKTPERSTASNAARPACASFIHPAMDSRASTPRWLWSQPDGWPPPPGWPSTGPAARQTHDAVVATVRFDSLPRPIIDGRETGFCKLVVDRKLHTILGCHVVGERAVELAQLAATAMAAQMPVEQLALVPFSFPTYANALGRAAVVAAVELDHTAMWAVEHLVTPETVGMT